MQAIILAGGLGTRLKTVVADKPKALSPVDGKPFLHYIIEYLQKQGITKFFFSLGHLAEQVLEYLEQSHPSLSYKYTIEETPLGTGGGIKKAMGLVTNDNVLVVNADTYFNVPLVAMFNSHKATNAICTVSLKPMTNFDRYGSVEMDSNNTIISFKEKQFTHSGLINGGYLIINKNYFLTATASLPEAFSFEKEFLEKHLQEMNVKGFVCDGYFIDIGIPEDFAKAQQAFRAFAHL